MSIDGGDDLHKLVGAGGEVLAALEELTRLAVERETGVPCGLSLDIAGWRASRRAELLSLGTVTARNVLATGETVRLSPMTRFERDVVQEAVAMIAGVGSECVGEEPDRRVVIFRTGGRRG